MTMTADTPRRQRRPISSQPATTSAPASVQPTAATDALISRLDQLRLIARTKQYALLGRLSRAQIMRPEGLRTIDFRKEGPVLGIVPRSDQLIVTGEWKGIPPKWDDTDEFCPDCQTPCDVCKVSGKKACEAYQCGGAGKLPNGQACPVCKGTGQMICSTCRGTTNRPTGNKNGSTNWRDPSCETCGGSKFKHAEIPQPIEPFVNARVGSMLALGPIIRFAIESVGGAGTPPEVFDVEADPDGQHLVLLLTSAQPGAEAFLLGGVLNSQSRR